MYIGRFIVVTPAMAGYRVSSRSFPNRKIIQRNGALTVTPTAAAEPSDNPYIAYNCLRETNGSEFAVVGNGSHVDPITEKLELGYPPRDALVEALLALDYEKDDYDTPRIAGTLSKDYESYIGIVRRDAVIVEAVSESMLVATYEDDSPVPIEIATSTAPNLAEELYGLDYEHPVCACAIATNGDSFSKAVYNHPDSEA